MMEWSCATCGIVQWMPEEMNEQLRKTHDTFFCLTGHRNVYRAPTDTEALEEKLASAYSSNAQLEARLKVVEKENADLQEIKQTLKVISDKAGKSFLKRLLGDD